MIYLFHLSIDWIGRLIIRKSADASRMGSIVSFVQSLYSIHYSSWRLAAVGSVIAGVVMGFGTINAVVDEYLLLAGHGSSVELRRAIENRCNISDTVARLKHDIEDFVRVNSLGTGAFTKSSRSGPGAWSKHSALLRLAGMQEGAVSLQTAETELGVALLLLESLRDKRERSRHVIGRTLRYITCVLCAGGVYRLCMVVGAGLLSSVPYTEYFDGSIPWENTVDRKMLIASEDVGVPAASMVDGMLVWIHSARRLHRCYPLVSFLVLGSLAGSQFNGLFSTVQVLLHLEASARSTEAISLSLAYLAGSYFMACLLMLQRQGADMHCSLTYHTLILHIIRQFPSIKQVGFSEAFGNSFANTASDACTWQEFIFHCIILP